MTHNPSWLYANYKVYDVFLGINESNINLSNYALNTRFLSIFLLSIFQTFFKFLQLIFLKIEKDKFSELILYDRGDHSKNLFNKDNFSNPKFISIFDQNKLFRSSRFSLYNFLKILIKNYKITGEVLRMPPSHLKKAIIDHLSNSLPNSIFYEYFFDDLVNQNSEVRIVSSSCLIFPLTIASNLGINIKIRMHGLMGRVMAQGFPLINKFELFHKDEIDYFKKLLPSCSLGLAMAPSVEQKQKLVIIFLRQTLEFMHDTNDDNFSNARLLHSINFFQEKGYIVFLKLHPYSSFHREDLGSTFQNFKFVDKERSASEVISSLSPSFVLGWLSSSLIEALNMGVIPITLESKPYDSIVSKKTIVSFEKRVLNYETDIQEIDGATKLAKNYSKIISFLNL